MKIIKLFSGFAVAAMLVLNVAAAAQTQAKTNIAFHKKAYASLYQNIPGMGEDAMSSSWSVSDTQSALPSYDETAQLVTDGIIPDINNIPDYPLISATNINGGRNASKGVSAVGDKDLLNLIDGQSATESAITFEQDKKTPISDANPLLINVILPAPAKVTKYSMLPRFGQNSNNTKPYAWKLQASEDGVNYVDVDNFTSQQQLGSGELPLIQTEKPFNGKDDSYYDSDGYDFYSYNAGSDGTWGTKGVQRDTTAEKPYKYYRLYITQMNDTSKGTLTLSLADFSLFAESSNGTYKNVLRNPFISRWKSTANEKQWVYIDLGKGAKYDSAKLYWGNDSYPTNYKIQVSDDVSYNYGDGGGGKPATWRDIATVTKPQGGTDTVNFAPQTARYIRMYADTRVADSKDYKLYEFEVYGAGAKPYQNPPRPAAQKDGAQQLSGGDWNIARADGVAETGEQLSSSSYQANNMWIPALVPGTALKSYIAAGVIPDTNFDMDMMQVSDTYFNSDFWYRTSFDIPATMQGKNVYLNFDAVSWKAKVFVNGHYVDEIDGAFKRGKFDVTKYANIGGKNYLAVLAVAPMHYGAPRTKSYGTPNNNGGLLGADNPSIHASIGWDWVPVIRGRNTGLYDKVYLTYTGGVNIENPWVVTDFNLAQNPGPDGNKYDFSKASATLKAEVVNTAGSDQDVTVKGTFNPGNIAFSKDITVSAGATESVEIPVTINNPKIWWPNTYGAQPLYTANVSVNVNGKVSDQKTFHFGVRKLEYTYTGDFNGGPGNAVPSDSAFNVYCNGVRIFLRGGNWGMDDSNVNLSDEDYRVRLKLHALENFTMIRDWVGQTGKEAFWNAADEYGILVYDDFWLSNPWDGTDPLDQAMFIDNVKDKILKVRSHPSEALYCARNEGVVARPLDSRMQKAVETLDGTRAYIRASNNVVWGINGNGPYTEQERKLYYIGAEPENRFAGADFQLHTERGQHVIPNPELFKLYFRPENIWPGMSAQSTAGHPWRVNVVAANTWGVHDFFFGGNGPAGNFMEALAAYVPLATLGGGTDNNIKAFSKYSQMPNYDLHRAMFEAFAEKKGSGILMWMSMSVWPSFAWRSFDYFYDTSSAYFGIKKACSPLAIIWNPTNGPANTDRSISNSYNPNPGTVSVVNNTGKPLQNLKAAVKYFTTKGGLISSEEVSIDKLAVDEVRVVSNRPWPEARGDMAGGRVNFLKLELRDGGGKLLADNFYWKDIKDTDKDSVPDYTELRNIPNAEITASYAKLAPGKNSARYAVTLKNASKNIALQIRVKASDKNGNLILPAYYSDNYVNLLPGESKIIDVELETLYFAGAPALGISGFNVPEKTVPAAKQK